MVVKINKIINEISGLAERLDFLAVDTLCFEDGEKILNHGVVIAVSLS